MQNNSIAFDIILSVERRFLFVLDQDDVNFNLKFKLSTLFDPCVVHLLDEEEIAGLLPALYAYVSYFILISSINHHV